MSEFTESIRIAAAPEIVWRTLADIGSISDWNPGVEHSRQTSHGAVDIGARRHCDLDDKHYLDEEVTAFEPCRWMTVRITGTNLPLRTAEIRFALVADTDDTLVTVSPVYRLKFGIFGSVLDALVVRRRYRKGMRQLLRGLKEHIEGVSAS